MMMDLKQLYQEVIVDHGRHPRNQGVLKSATHSQEGYNPLCGDQLHVFLIVKNDCIQDVKFTGKGCAISMASASLLLEAIKGKTVSEFKNLFDSFQAMMADQPHGELEKLEVLAGVKEFPMRVKCATLAWHAVKGALENKKESVRTEE